MAYTKVIEWIDIQAPRQEVFGLITDIERRLQLSPLWGLASLEARCGDYPNVGSGYLVRLASDPDPEQQPLHETVITEYQPYQKFAYCLDVDQQTSVTWTLQEIRAGTRLTYCEEFIVDETNASQAQEFTRSVREIVRQMLSNIQRYAELRESSLKRLARWLVDHFYLHLRPDQRKTLTAVLFLQIVGIFTFITAAIGFGLVSLLQKLF
jgi:uncharacterized protein YndB with AHSA1/START domain